MSVVNVTREDRICRIVLNRPEVLNAIDGKMVEATANAIAAAAADPDLRVITVEGAGRAFCTGADLKAKAEGAATIEMFVLWEEAMRALEISDKITLCLVHGYAIGGGLQFALACDIRVVTAGAKIGLTATKEGFIPGFATWRLARYIGLGRAKKLIIGGEMLGAAEAERIGLVDHIIPEEGRAAAFKEIVAGYLANASLGCRLSKQLLADCCHSDFDAFLSRYRLAQETALASDDAREAATAHDEGREPVWR